LTDTPENFLSVVVSLVAQLPNEGDAWWPQETYCLVFKISLEAGVTNIWQRCPSGWCLPNSIQKGGLDHLNVHLSFLFFGGGASP